MAIKSILVFLFVSFASFFTTAQQPGKTYDREWNTIDSLLRKEGLAKSALNRVNLIYNAAKKENNDVQVIKALVYRLQINEEISEEGMYENIQLLEKEIVDANGIAPVEATGIIYNSTAPNFMIAPASKIISRMTLPRGTFHSCTRKSPTTSWLHCKRKSCCRRRC